MGYRSLVHLHFTHPPLTMASTGGGAQKHEPLNIRGNTAGYIPIVDTQPLFNCDDDPRTIASRKITTVSRAVAADRVITSEAADMLLTIQGQDYPAEDDIIVGGGTNSTSDAEYGGTTILLGPTTPRIK
jgi:hypothetical protein